jgi:rhodanese-related sulfurtransferase
MSAPLTRRLGLGALALGATAAFAGSPYRRTDGRLDIAQTLQLIEDGGDHVSALQLAGWIRDQRPGLRIIDVRSPAEFAEFAIPTAENIELPALVHADFTPTSLIALYSEGGAHAGQAWVLLRALGITNAFFIAGGLADWREEVLSPVLAEDASAEAVEAFQETAALSRYFGGSPRTGGTPAARDATPAGRIAAIRRRGC